MPFIDRRDAGRQLAEKLRQHTGRETLVLGLPRGGIPVAYEVAQALDAPLDVFLVRKLGAPTHEELAMRAIASGGVRVLNPEVIASLRISREIIDLVAAREQRELERREREYRDDRPPPETHGRTVILVDDGLATGATMRAAVLALRKKGARRIVVGVPVASQRACEEFREVADEIVCVETPVDFAAVGEWYYDFSQTSDGEVRDLLARAEAKRLDTPAAH